jgi:uncharacterized protein VirK/YbjX
LGLAVSFAGPFLQALRDWPGHLRLVRQIYPAGDAGSLWLRARLAWQMFSHAALQREVLGKLEAMGQGDLFRAQPRLLRKLYVPYPCTGLGARERADWLLQHHALAPDLLGPALWTAAMAPGGALIGRISLPKAQGQLALWLVHTARFQGEGDLILELRDPFDTPLYSLTLSFHQPAAGEVGLFVGAVHGRVSLDLARHLTKLCFGVRPPSLLVAALQALARGLGVQGIRAVGRARHVYSGTARESRVQFDYDALWLSVGAEDLGDGCFGLPLQARERSHEEMPGHKRSLYLRRYAWLAQVDVDLQRGLQAARMGTQGDSQ